MKLIAQIGIRFYDELQKAKAEGLNTNFYNEASSLIMILSGDANSGVRESVGDAEKDNRLMSNFLEKWGNDLSVKNYPELMKAARASKNSLDGFLETVKELSEEEKLNIERYGRFKESIGYGSYESGYASGEKIVKVVKSLFSGIRSLFK